MNLTCFFFLSLLLCGVFLLQIKLFDIFFYNWWRPSSNTHDKAHTEIPKWRLSVLYRATVCVLPLRSRVSQRFQNVYSQVLPENRCNSCRSCNVCNDMRRRFTAHAPSCMRLPGTSVEPARRVASIVVSSACTTLSLCNNACVIKITHHAFISGSHNIRTLKELPTRQISFLNLPLANAVVKICTVQSPALLKAALPHSLKTNPVHVTPSPTRKGWRR